MKKFFSQIFQASNGNYSSKRFLGIISGLTLCITLFLNSFFDSLPAESLVNAVALLSFGCLGLTSADMIFKKNIEKEITIEEMQSETPPDLIEEDSIDDECCRRTRCPKHNME